MVRFNPAPAIRKVNMREHDAISCLTRDHDIIRRLFRYYEHLVKYEGSNDQKADTAGQICFKWCVHIQIEEEIFYPAAKKLLKADTRVRHALEDHAGSRELVAMLDELEAGDADFDGAIGVLAGYVLPHVDEEEGELFPLLAQLGLEVGALGQSILQRHKELNGDVTSAAIWRHKEAPNRAGEAGPRS